MINVDSSGKENDRIRPLVLENIIMIIIGKVINIVVAKSVGDSLLLIQ